MYFCFIKLTKMYLEKSIICAKRIFCDLMLEECMRHLFKLITFFFRSINNARKNNENYNEDVPTLHLKKKQLMKIRHKAINENGNLLAATKINGLLIGYKYCEYKIVN